MGTRMNRVLVAGLAVAILSAGCGGSAPQAGATPNAGAAQITAPTRCAAPTSVPETGPVTEEPLDGSMVQATISTPVAPIDITVAAGSVWVVAHRSQTIYRVNPASSRVEASIQPDVSKLTIPDWTDYAIAGLAPAPDGVWVELISQPNQLSLIDAATSTFTDQFPVPVVADRSIGINSAWLADSGPDIWAYVEPYSGMPKSRLLQIDRRTGQVVRTLSLPIPAQIGPTTYVPDLVNAFGSLWAVVQNNEIARVDPASGKVVALVRTPGTVAGAHFAVAGDRLFVLLKSGQPDGAVLARIDPASNCVDMVTDLIPHHRIDPVCNVSYQCQVGALAAAGRMLYVSFDQGALALVDTTTLRVVRAVWIDNQSYTGGVAFAFGSVWYPTFDNDTVVRLKPLG